jgi:hypothetical protein
VGRHTQTQSERQSFIYSTSAALQNCKEHQKGGHGWVLGERERERERERWWVGDRERDDG